MLTFALTSFGLITPEAREREGRGALEGLGGHGFSLQRFFSGRLVEVHKHWAYVLLALVVVWLAVRLAAEGRSVRWHRLATGVGVLALIALVATGYYGGDLVYGRRGRERERGSRAGRADRPRRPRAAARGAVDRTYLCIDIHTSQGKAIAD